jgi:hypothetical protein
MTNGPRPTAPVVGRPVLHLGVPGKQHRLAGLDVRPLRLREGPAQGELGAARVLRADEGSRVSAPHPVRVYMRILKTNRE